MRILFLISSLDFGGAERQVALLARTLRERGHEVSVAVLRGGGAFQVGLAEAGVGLHDLGRRSRVDILRCWFRLVGLVRRERPEVVHAYLDVAHVLSAPLRLLASSVKVVWAIRSSDMDLTRYSWGPRLVHRFARALAPLAHLHVANSRAGMLYHAALGYRADRMAFVPNGIEADRFRPDEAARAGAREGWGVGADERVIGVVARLDPMKGHDVLLEALARMKRGPRPHRVLCIGDGAPEQRQRLVARCAELGLAGRVHWLPATPRVCEVYNGLDLICSPSRFGEGMSNAICEAMACGKPAVVTDVGDSRRIVGDTGRVVPPADPAALGAALDEMLELDGEQLAEMGARARERVLELLSPVRQAVLLEEALQPLLG